MLTRQQVNKRLYIPQTRPDDWKTTRDLLTVETTSEPPPAPVLLPAVFRPIPPLDIAKSTAGPPDFWASEYTVEKIGPWPLPAYPTANETGRR